MSQFFAFEQPDDQIIHSFLIQRERYGLVRSFFKCFKIVPCRFHSPPGWVRKAEAIRSLGKSETEPKILSHGKENPVLYLFKTLFGLAEITPESDSESSSLALLRWLSGCGPAPEEVPPPDPSWPLKALGPLGASEGPGCCGAASSEGATKWGLR